MRLRGTLLLVACAVLLLVVTAPGATADGHTYVEERSFRFYPVIQDQTFFEGDFHPEGDAALLAGGSYGREPAPDDQYMLRYDGDAWQVVFKKTGTHEGPLVDVGWRPHPDDVDAGGNGSGNFTDYALVVAAGGFDKGGQLRGSILACVEPCTGADHVTQLWDPRITPLANGGFAGRQVAWHPGGDHALVSGSGLIRWNGSTFTAVDLGEETFFNAIEWHPSGEFALVQKDLNRVWVCWDPCKTKADLQPTGIHFGEGDGSKNIESFAFHPDGDRAYVTGLDKQRAKLLELHLTNRSRPDTWTTAYYNPRAESRDGDSFDKYGEITEMEWYSDGSEALLTSSLRRQVMTFPDDPAGRHDFGTLLDQDGPKFYDVTLQPPDGNYSLMGGQHGFYRYDPDGVPFVEVTSPDPASTPEHVDPFTVEGTAEPKRDGRNITDLQWMLTQDPRSFGHHHEGNWTNLTDDQWTRADDGTVHWSHDIDPSDMQPGIYRLGVRADDGEVLGPPGVATFEVPGPEVSIRAPANHTEVQGIVPVNGSAEARAPDSEITEVQWRISSTRDTLDPRFGTWHDANLTDGPGHTVEWSFSWNTSVRRPCYHTIEVRALEDDIRGIPSHVVSYVPDCLDEAPGVSVDHVDDENKTVTISWDNVTAASSYVVEVGDKGFFENTTIGRHDGSTTSMIHDAGENGDYYYRVRASNPFEETGWGTQAQATVEDPPQDTDEENQAGDDGGRDFPDGDRDPDHVGGDGGDSGSDGTDPDGSDPGIGDGTGSQGDETAPGQDVPGPGAAAAALAAAAAAALRRRR